MTSKSYGVTVGSVWEPGPGFLGNGSVEGSWIPGKWKSRLIITDRKTWATESGGAVEGEGKAGETSGAAMGSCSLGKMWA